MLLPAPSYLAVFALLLVLSACNAQKDKDVGFVESCPEKYGFYADAVQCDRYYECKDGQILDQYCPDGLVFDESLSTAFAKCSFPFSVDCQGRPELQKAQPTSLCPRRNGYFAHEDPKVCDKFYFCVDGVANPITCPNTLIFDPTKGQCAYSDQVKRKGCSSEEYFNFVCPHDPNNAHEHPRYPDPADCQFFYLCIGGTGARRNGCTVGQVFNPDTLTCDRPSNVNGPCSGWYNDTFLESVGANDAPPASFQSDGGARLNEKPGRRVPVSKKTPAAAAVAPSDAQEQFQGVDLDEATLVRQPPPAAAAAAPIAASSAGGKGGQVRTRVKTRVRRPVQAAAAAAPAADIDGVDDVSPPGPPSFALSSDEAIQQFRQSNRFVPEAASGSKAGSNKGNGGGGRLTVLSGRPQPALQQQQLQDEEAEAGEEFTAFPAVPNRSGPFSGGAQRQSAASPPSLAQDDDTSEVEDFGQKSVVPQRRPSPSVSPQPSRSASPSAAASDNSNFPDFPTVEAAAPSRRGSLPSRRPPQQQQQEQSSSSEAGEDDPDSAAAAAAAKAAALGRRRGSTTSG